MEERAHKEAEADRAPSRLSAISSNLSAKALAFVKCFFPCRQNLFFKGSIGATSKRLSTYATVKSSPSMGGSRKCS